MTDNPRATQAFTRSRSISIPRPSTPLVWINRSSNAPSPQPTSSTRAFSVTISAMRRWSTRGVVCKGCCDRSISIPIAQPLSLASGRNAPLGRRGIDEPADGCEQFGLVEQEGVVAFIAFDFHERHVGGDGVQRLHDSLGLSCRIQPVTRKGDDAESRLRPSEGVGQHVTM